VCADLLKANIYEQTLSKLVYIKDYRLRIVIVSTLTVDARFSYFESNNKANVVKSLRWYVFEWSFRKVNCNTFKAKG